MSIVTVDELKIFGRIDPTIVVQDALLQTLIDGAESYVEKTICVKLTKADYIERLDGGGDSLFPENLPINSLATVKDKWLDDAVPPVTVFTTATQVRIENDGCWPAGPLRWEVTYNAGYDDTDIPAGLKTIIMQLAIRAYSTPDARVSGGSASARVSYGDLLTSDLYRQLCDFSLGKILT